MNSVIMEDNSKEKFRSDYFYDSINKERLREVKEIAQIDYGIEKLYEKDGNYFLYRAYSGPYEDEEPLSFERVERSTIGVFGVKNVNLTNQVEDAEFVDVVKEFASQEKWLMGVDRDELDPEMYWYKEGLPADENFDKTRVLERPDGSKVYGWDVNAEGDQTVFDAPQPVNLDLSLYENDEKQNARRYEQGFAIFDTRSGKGMVLVWLNGSEESEESRFKLDKKGTVISADTMESQRLVTFEHDGTIAQNEFWRAVKD